ncbi:hypothetical protein F8388_012129 [Cannabis sativa]|uniref:Uncharacterized protein n=1 Tax=Cannabis sativa TaxID=3483 RepID=A0A7J6GEH1_CANSA|nr:hypothetical protein G4B88_020536 [Cannabis sativa]KAF4381207.1 hypothetical protein F8388_012129 [Cannabis sativa]
MSLLPFAGKVDAYGVAMRPQHVQRYQENAYIYKEEKERSDRWNSFLELQAESDLFPVEDKKSLQKENSEKVADASLEKILKLFSVVNSETKGLFSFEIAKQIAFLLNLNSPIIKPLLKMRRISKEKELETLLAVEQDPCSCYMEYKYT